MKIIDGLPSISARMLKSYGMWACVWPVLQGIECHMVCMKLGFQYVCLPHCLQLQISAEGGTLPQHFTVQLK